MTDRGASTERSHVSRGRLDAERACIDAADAAYDELPLDTPDAWGDLESFRDAAGRTR